MKSQAHDKEALENYNKAVDKEYDDRMGKYLERTIAGVCKDISTGTTTKLESSENPWETKPDPIEMAFDFTFSFTNTKNYLEEKSNDFKTNNDQLDTTTQT